MAPTRRIAYVVGTYPLLTTTFIDREIALLRDLGFTVDITALRSPHGLLSPEQQRLADDVQYVLPVSMGQLIRSHVAVMLRRPVAFWRTLLHLLTRPHPDLRSRLKTVLHFGEGVHVAHLLRARRPDHIHAHFVDRATTVALVAGRLLHLPYSATAHANDIYVAPVLLPEKLSNAQFVVTCTQYNARHLRAVANGSAVDLVCIHHGLDLARYQPRTPEPNGRPLVLAVGQLKEKKGLRVLVDACAILRDRGYDVTCRIVGEGPDRGALESRIRDRDVADVIELTGALDHADVVAQYAAATVFTLPCVTGVDGDRDGIPNVILEAMAMQRPVVSTRHSGIPEAVADGVTGILVAPGDPVSLADALGRLLDDPALAREMGQRGRERVAGLFDLATNVSELATHFAQPDTTHTVGAQ